MTTDHMTTDHELRSLWPDSLPLPLLLNPIPNRPHLLDAPPREAEPFRRLDPRYWMLALPEN